MNALSIIAATVIEFESFSHTVEKLKPQFLFKVAQVCAEGRL